MQVKAQAGGSALRLIDDAIVRGAARQFAQALRGEGCELAWPALLRKLDRIDPDYKT